MGVYNVLIRPFVRNLDLDKASKIVVSYYKLLGRIPFRNKIKHWQRQHPNTKKQRIKEVFDIQFLNPIGLGAGLDLKGELYNELANLGISFVEIGPMGIENVRESVRNISRHSPEERIAACINKDYLTSFTLSYDFYDFFVIDITADPSVEYLEEILEARVAEQEYKPIIVKIPEYLNQSEIHEMVDYCLLNNVDGIESCSLKQIIEIKEYSKGMLPIIANNYVNSIGEVQEALDAGASLVEIRTALVREGPSYVKKILKSIQEKAQ